MWRWLLKNEESRYIKWKQPLQMGNMVIEVEDMELLPNLRLHEVGNLEKVVWVQHKK